MNETVGIGFNALSSLTIGDSCTAVRWNAANSFTIATWMSCFGGQSSAFSTSSDSTYLGYSCGNTVTGNCNMCVGAFCMDGSEAADDNTCKGTNCCGALTNSSNNCCYGSTCGLNLTSGSANCLFSYSCRASLNTSNNNTLIGSYSGATLMTENYVICIDTDGSITPTATNMTWMRNVYGSNSIVSVQQVYVSAGSQISKTSSVTMKKENIDYNFDSSIIHQL